MLEKPITATTIKSLKRKSFIYSLTGFKIMGKKSRKKKQQAEIQPAKPATSNFYTRASLSISAAVLLSIGGYFLANKPEHPRKSVPVNLETIVNHNTAQPTDSWYATPEMVEFAHASTKNITDPYQKAKILFDAIVNRGIRYDNPRRGFLRTAQEVHTLKHGQCMELASYYLALSRSIGLNTVPILLTYKYDSINSHVVAGLMLPNNDLIPIDLSADPPLFHGLEKNTFEGTKKFEGLTDTQFKGEWLQQNGSNHFREGNYTLALSEHLEALKYRQTSDLHCNIGGTYLQLNNVPDAQTAFTTALTLDPDCSLALSGLSAVAYQQRDYTRAEQYATDAISKNPNEIMALDVLGAIYLYRNQYDRALHYFNKALAIDPTDPNAIKNIKIITERLRK